MTRAQKSNLTGLGFIAPACLLFILFSLIPLIKGISLSMYKADAFGSEFVGLSNFKEMFASRLFWKGFRHTLVFTGISVPIFTSIPLFVSILAARTTRAFQYYIRFAFYIPEIAAGVVIVAVWKWIFHPINGILNYILGTNIAWLGQNPYAMTAIEIMLVTSAFGMAVMFFMARLLSIDKEIYDAAKIDGAKWYHEIRYITLPLIMPMIAFIVITRTIGYLQTWEYPYMMSGGGPNNGTTTMALQMYQNGVLVGRWGYAAAIGMFLLLITLTLAIIQRRIFR